MCSHSTFRAYTATDVGIYNMGSKSPELVKHVHKASCAAVAVSWAIVVASIVADLAELLQRKDGSKQVWNRLMAGMGRRTGEVRGTAIVSGDSLPHCCISSEIPHDWGVACIGNECLLVRKRAV